MKDILVENQRIEISWNNANRKHYESRGYTYTKLKDKFYVKVEDLSSGSNHEIELICDYCNCKYTKVYMHYKKSHKNSNKDACDNCKTIKSHETLFVKNKDRLWNDLVSTCNQFGYKILTTRDEYTSTKMKISYLCPKHGVKTCVVNNLKSGHGCDECGRELAKNKNKNTNDNVINIIESRNNNKLLNPQDYINAHKNNLQIKCECGNIFTTSLRNYKKSTNRCRDCSRKMSLNEKRIYDFLTQNNIEFKREHTFIDCKDINVLPFDFYLPVYNLCIEFDGQQHYDDYFYKTLNKTGSLEYTQYHDKIKNEYCIKNNINLLRIPYWEENNIEKIIQNKLEEINNNIILDKRYSLVS